MNDKGDEAPKIVTHRIPRIEIYDVTSEELQRIEEGSGQVAQDLVFALASGSSCISFVIALLTGTFSDRTAVVLAVSASVLGVTAIYTGVRWWRHRSTAPNVIAGIRSRRVDPEDP